MLIVARKMAKSPGKSMLNLEMASCGPKWTTSFIGIPFSMETLEPLATLFALSNKPVWITDDIVTTGEIPMNEEFEELDANMYIKEGSNWYRDELLDDRALIIKTSEELVVILGCAHRGAFQYLTTCTRDNRSRVNPHCYRRHTSY